MKLLTARNFEIRFLLLRIFQGASFLSIFRMNQTPRASNLKLKRFENAIGTPFPSLQQQSTGVYQRLIYSNFSESVRLRHVFGNHSFIKSYGSEQWISEIFPPYTRTFNKKKKTNATKQFLLTANCNQT